MSENDDIRVLLEQEGPYAFKVNFEGTGLADLHTDEPAPLGSGSGPSPSALLLAGIANCLAASLVFALRKYKNEVAGLRATIEAIPSRNAEGRLRIPKAFVTLELPGNNADYQQLERILAQFENFCTVTQSVREGIEVEVTVKDIHGHTLLGDKSFEAGS